MTPLLFCKKKEVILNSVTVTFSTFLQFILCRVVHQYNKFRLRNRAHFRSFSCIGHRIFYSPPQLHILELKSFSIVLEVPQSRPEGPKKSDWMPFLFPPQHWLTALLVCPFYFLRTWPEWSDHHGRHQNQPPFTQKLHIRSTQHPPGTALTGTWGGIV